MKSNVISIIVSILSGLVALTALLLGQITSNYNAGIATAERLTRIEENQNRNRAKLDAVGNELKNEARTTRDEIRDDGQCNDQSESGDK